MGAVATDTDRSRPASPASLPARVPRLRSPVARAVVPVLGGAAVIALILLGTWGVAALISHGGAETAQQLAPPTFAMGSAADRAASIAEDGPLVLADLHTTRGDRTLVVDHVGDDPTAGWRLYWGYPADRDATCPVTQVRGTRTFVDCAGRRLDVSDLALPPRGVFPVVEDDERLVIDLRVVTTTS
jgi:hypothetical protein